MSISSGVDRKFYIGATSWGLHTLTLSWRVWGFNCYRMGVSFYSWILQWEIMFGLYGSMFDLPPFQNPHPLHLHPHSKFLAKQTCTTPTLLCGFNTFLLEVRFIGTQVLWSKFKCYWQWWNQLGPHTRIRTILLICRAIYRRTQFSTFL